MAGKWCPLCTGKVSGGRWGVNEAEIQRAFTDAGLLAPDMRDVMNDHLDFAKTGAPRRTGRLSKSHRAWMGAPFGYSRRYYIRAEAGYARFLQGTRGQGSGRIYPIRGETLNLRPFPYSWFVMDDGRRLQASVRGQRRHHKADWLAEAAESAFDWNGLDPKFFAGIAALT